MATYKVPVGCFISYYVEVEADSKEEAIQSAYDSNEFPGEVMLLDHNYPDMGEWEVDADWSGEPE